VADHPINTSPPIARQILHTETIHGRRLEDNYRWLLDPDNPAVLDYLHAENAYAETMLAPLQGLRKRLYDEFLSRVEETDSSVPTRWGDYRYYQRQTKGDDYTVYCRRLGEDGAEQVLLDVNQLAQGQNHHDLGDLAISPDHRYLAYQEDLRGDESYRIVIKDLQLGEILPDIIENTHAGLSWANDNQTLFYLIDDHAHRPHKVRAHRLGTPAKRDRTVLKENKSAFYLQVGQTKDRQYQLFESASHLSSEIRLLKADQPEGKPQLFLPRLAEREYTLEHSQGHFLVLTNHLAENFEVWRVPSHLPLPHAKVGDDGWQRFIADESGIKIEGIEPFRDYLVVYVREEGVAKIRIYDANGEYHRIEFPETWYTAEGDDNPSYDSPNFRLSYTSWITPEAIYDYDPHARRLHLLKQEQVPAGYDSSAYVSDRIWATSADGEQIPVSLIYRRDRHDRYSGQPGPALLYGYGAYGVSLEPEFSPLRLSLLDRGFVCAFAHVRGGGEQGEFWHHDGRLTHKPHSFADFIAAAEALFSLGYTTPDQLSLMGGSAGGLLIGTVLNQRPDICRVAVAQVPFVDVLTAMLDPSLPLTVIEYDEWGDPRDPEIFRVMSGYCPLQNVVDQAYPHLLVSGGLHDPRVPHWQPARWVAKLRAHKTDDHLLLLRTDMTSGHDGVSGRYESLAEVAIEYAFILHVLD